MAIGDKIRDEKLQCSINREATNISAFFSVKLANMNILHAKKCYLPIEAK